MRGLIRCLLLGSFCLCADKALPHGIPINVSVVNGRLHTSSQIFTESLDFIPGFGYETEMPGIGVAAGSGIPTNTPLSFNVVDNLFYWNGTELAPTAATLAFENALGHSVSVTQNTIFENSPLFGTYNGVPGWHEHGYFVLDLGAPVGVYGMVITITAPGFAYSEPVLLAFNRGLSTAQFNAGVDAIAATQFGLQGDINLDGQVDGADYVIWASNFKQPGTRSEGDLNRDGVVDGADYLLWASNFAPSTSAALPSALTIPEPASGILIALGALCAIAMGSWRRTTG